MSVPVNQRSHGKLEAYTKAYDLATYTLRITANKKVFTVEYQEALTDKMIAIAIDIYLIVARANDAVVRTKDDLQNFRMRINMQIEAHKKCGDLIRLILLAKPIFHLSEKRIKYWTGLARDTKTLIKAWSDSDRKRFMPLFEDRDVG